MEAIKTRKSKFLVVLIVFMILFSNFGYTIAAIATSDEFEVVSNGFFKKDEVKFNAYFEDENGKKTSEITENVNRKIKLVVEILPQIEGYLKSGYIKAVSSNDDDLNFKFTSVTENLLDDKNVDVEKDLNNTLVKPEEKIDDELLNQEGDMSQDENKISEDMTSTNSSEENVVGDTNSSLLDALVNSDVNPLSEAVNSAEKAEVNEEENEVSSNPLINALANSETNTIGTEAVNPGNDENKVDEINSSEVTNQELPTEGTVAEEDKLIDEDAIIEEKTEESRLDEEIRNAILDINLTSDNEVSLSNIIKDTKIEIELEFVQKETLNVEDLCKNIKLQMGGTYINRDLEEIKIGKEEEVTVGWEYTKDFSLESEYTKFSPFELENIKGTIVENKITVTRDIEDSKYLPLKSTRLEVVVPKVNGKNPIEVDVLASKLMATRGEDTGNTVFEARNWKYDQTNGLINVYVENENNIYSKGSDEYVIIYRYEDYINEENSNLLNKVKATVTEYNGKQNNTLTKEINNSQDIQVDLGELITYSIETNQDKINKAKIYANYNSEEALYETLFTNQVNVNILTSDILEQLKIDCSKEIYKDSNNVEFEAQGIEYKKVKFNYSEISSILAEGGEIVITNTNNETLYILNKDVITNETDCEINLNGANGIIVYANNIAKNGTINFELTKAIKKCNYDKPVFKSIAKIESRISAEVKYSKIEDRLQLQTISTSKDFEESQTSATLSMNRDTLSTIKTNGNVELRVELNNDKETSDLYINPIFEIVFPKYVTSVRIDAINLLNDCGLRVSDFETYTESDIVKMRIELSGTQTKFSENSITKGTNIIINADIEVDDYAPAKEDQIKLYYCNEGVATYQSQTKWSIKKNIPNGILKTTNGFDVEVIKYQAPTGLIAINGIVNYDGNLSEVKSVKQGTVSKQIPINSPSRIATMELLALNNTENTCSDITLLGRVPFKGNKDVISNEDLGTTTDCRMLDSLKEDIQNGNTATIYYSTNPTANKDLTDGNNGWVTTIQDMSTVRSYMIVVKGEVEAGAVLRYTYDFEIPENLPYEAKITGSFGVFYNNKKEEAVVYETSSADHVVLETEAGPKIEAKLSVDVGDGNEVLAGKRLKYTVAVTNTGSVSAENVVVKSDVPDYTRYTTRDNVAYGDYGYVSNNEKEIVEEIGTIEPGETEEISYYVTTSRMPSLEEYASGNDENGYFIYDVTTDEKKYIEEPEIFIKNKAIIETSLLANSIETNEVSNKLQNANFESKLSIDYDRRMISGMETNFRLNLTNISNKDLNDVVAVFNIGKVYTYEAGSIKVLIDEEYTDLSDSIVYNQDEDKIYFNIGNMKKSSNYTLEVKVIANSLTKVEETSNCYFEFSSAETEKEYSTMIEQRVVRSMIEASDMSINIPKEIKEDSIFTVSTEIRNIGEIDCNTAEFKYEFSDNLEIEKAICSTGSILPTNGDNSILARLPNISANSGITADITFKVKNITGNENSIGSVKRTISNLEQDDIILDPVEITIINDKKTNEEIEQENIQKEYDAYIDFKEENGDQEQNTNVQENESLKASNEQINSNQDNTDNINVNPITNLDTNVNKAIGTSSEDIKVEDNSMNYTISGLVWNDSNKNGVREDTEELLNGIKVYLLTSNNNMIKSTVTSSDGKYVFNDVANGKYLVGFSYDNAMYDLTIYNKPEAEANVNSDVIETNQGDILAISNEITVQDGNIDNIDMGLFKREQFDLVVNKYVSAITLKTKKDTKTYKYDNLELAKIEIPSKYINDSQLDLEYTIIIENKGDIEGSVKDIVDYLPENTIFDESKNESWYKGNNEEIHAKDVNQILKPGEKRELKLILSKNIDEDNMGTIYNKIAILDTENQLNIKENTTNNTSVQNVLVLVATGKTVQIIVSATAIVFIMFIIYNQNLMNKITFKKDKIYKADVKSKRHHLKKNYK